MSFHLFSQGEQHAGRGWAMFTFLRDAMFLTMQCLGDVLTNPLLYDVLDDVLKKPKHCACNAYIAMFS